MLGQSRSGGPTRRAPLAAWLALSIGAALTAPALPIRSRRLGTRPPLRFQRLHVRPAYIHAYVRHDAIAVGRVAEILGRVVLPGDWDLQRRELSDDTKRRALIGLAQGLGPEASGYVAWMQRQAERPGWNHGCSTLEEILERAARLEAMIDELRTTGRMRSRAELEPLAFRERGGVEVCVGRDGTIIKASNGDHRLAFAQALDLAAIPVCLVAVHPEALRNGAWQRVAAESDRLGAAVTNG